MRTHCLTKNYASVRKLGVLVRSPYLYAVDPWEATARVIDELGDGFVYVLASIYIYT